MFLNQRAYAVRRLLIEYVESPSLRHLRDPNSINRLAEQIVKEIDGEPSVWRKWQGKREELLRASAECWVPAEDLREFLNEMPGPHLTLTDVAQRLRAMHEEPYSSYPNSDLQEACSALYEWEKAEGTELPAIIGRLQEFVEEESERLRREREEGWRQRQEEERLALQQRFLSGADCKWTALEKSKEVYTRKNGRAYRLDPREDKRWDLYRIEAPSDRGTLVGRYGSRGDANKVIAKIAYEPEPRW